MSTPIITEENFNTIAKGLKAFGGICLTETTVAGFKGIFKFGLSDGQQYCKFIINRPFSGYSRHCVEYNLNLPPFDFDTYSEFNYQFERYISVLEYNRRELEFNKCEHHPDGYHLSGCPARFPSKKKIECGICFESFDENTLTETPCGHFFCLKCLDRWVELEENRQLPCPMCRCQLSRIYESEDEDGEDDD